MMCVLAVVLVARFSVLRGLLLNGTACAEHALQLPGNKRSAGCSLS